MLKKNDQNSILSGLAKTRKTLFSGLAGFFRAGKINEENIEELETVLLSADVGVDAADKIITALRDRQISGESSPVDMLKTELTAMLKGTARQLSAPREKPWVLLVVGVNGVGKTTTIGKIAALLKKRGKTVMLAAGDTFRAAAVEQLVSWGETNNVAVVSQPAGSDSASVIYDAVVSAKARGVDVVLADTAGRLHTKTNLMEELKKIKRAMQKIDNAYPHDTLLVIDAGTGQNAISQVRAFHEDLGVDGLVVTKMDGTAKGGIVFALADKFGIPVRFIGVGEGRDDLKDFAAAEFVNALFTDKVS